MMGSTWTRTVGHNLAMQFAQFPLKLANVLGTREREREHRLTVSRAIALVAHGSAVAALLPPVALLAQLAPTRRLVEMASEDQLDDGRKVCNGAAQARECARVVEGALSCACLNRHSALRACERHGCLVPAALEAIVWRRLGLEGLRLARLEEHVRNLQQQRSPRLLRSFTELGKSKNTARSEQDVGAHR